MKKNEIRKREINICVMGLGYVGLPLAIHFAREGFDVYGYDCNKEKIKSIKRDIDPNKNIKTLHLTTDQTIIKKCDFIFVCVPTPLNNSNEPDLSFVKSAAKTIGKNISRNSTVILESTVYPGVTEDVLKKIIEKTSGLECSKDFKIAYSPERINPGDKKHEVCNTAKIVAGIDKETTEIVKFLYKTIIKADVYEAKSIKEAEAAKLVENIQRDLNIALINELALIFEKMDIDIFNVLDAASSKWNFIKFYPGLVGGHCIPIAPYYLIKKSKDVGYYPKIILAGREINNYIPMHITNLTLDALKEAGKNPKVSKILILGLSYKENIGEARGSLIKLTINSLKKSKIKIVGFDPFLNKDTVKKEFGIDSCKSIESGLRNCDGLILSTLHDEFKALNLKQIINKMNKNPIFIDVRGFFEPQKIKKTGFVYRGFGRKYALQ